MKDLSKFAETLESLIFENKITASQLAQNVGIDVSTVARYLNDKRAPSIDTLIKLADYFCCSCEYLLGRIAEDYYHTFYTCPKFSEQLKFLKDNFKCSWRHFYTTADISASRFYEWKNGNSEPTLDCVIALAKGFNCSVDFVLGRTKG